MADSDFARAPIIVLSSIDWEAAWQRHQAFALEWARRGHRVVFVENTGFRDLLWSDLDRLGGKLRRWVKPANAPAAGAPITVVNPLTLPPTGRLFQRLNYLFFLPRLAEKISALGGENAVAVAYLPTATTAMLLDAVAPRLTIYDCVDNFAGHPAPPPDLAQRERELLSRSAFVVTTSSTLRAAKAKAHERVLELHQGVPPQFFIDARPRPRVEKLCYFGTIWDALDFEALGALGRAGFTVDLIGPVKGPIPALAPSIKLKPAVAYARLPGVLSAYDALLLPYRRSDYNVGVVPAKTYECLATGLPVLSSPLPALEPLRGVLDFADSPEDWIRVARGLAVRENDARRAARVERAKEHIQERVFDALYDEARRAWNASPSPARAASPSPLTDGILWLGGLYGAARALTFATQVVAGRWLGPAAYGKANLVVAASSYLQILPMLGFPLAVSKHMPEDAGPEEEARTVSTALLGFTAWGAAWLALLASLRGPLAAWLRLPSDIFDSSLLLAFLTAGFTVYASPFLGGRAFAKRGGVELAYAAAAAAALGWLAWSGRSGYQTLIDALCVALGVGTALSLFLIGSFWRLRPVFDTRRFKSLFSYALVGSLNLLSTAFLLAPGRLMLHRYRAAHDIGVFSAYFTATIQISLALLTMAAAVIVPIASTPEGQSDLWRRFARRAPALAAAAAALFALTTAVGLRFFGKQYPFRLEWLLLFAAAGALILMHGLIGALFSARNIAGLSISAAGSLVSGLGNAVLCRALVPSFGISGAAWALAASYGAGMLFFAAAGLNEWAR